MAVATDKLLYRAEEAADLLGIRKSKFYELVNAGHIKKTNLPGKYEDSLPTTRFHIKDIEAFADKQRGN